MILDLEFLLEPIIIFMTLRFCSISSYHLTVNHFIYILETANGSYYTGYTTDLERRFLEHQNKKGAKYTRAFGAKKLIYSEVFTDKSSALKREAAIKKLTRSQKEILIQR